jgi:hypothetical protein
MMALGESRVRGFEAWRGRECADGALEGLLSEEAVCV